MISKRRNDPTIERAVEAARVNPLSLVLDLLPLLLCDIFIGFVTAHTLTANLSSAINASLGVI